MALLALVAVCRYPSLCAAPRSKSFSPTPLGRSRSILSLSFKPLRKDTTSSSRKGNLNSNTYQCYKKFVRVFFKGHFIFTFRRLRDLKRSCCPCPGSSQKSVTFPAGFHPRDLPCRPGRIGPDALSIRPAVKQQVRPSNSMVTFFRLVINLRFP